MRKRQFPERRLFSRSLFFLPAKRIRIVLVATSQRALVRRVQLVFERRGICAGASACWKHHAFTTTAIVLMRVYPRTVVFLLLYRTSVCRIKGLRNSSLRLHVGLPWLYGAWARLGAERGPGRHRQRGVVPPEGGLPVLVRPPRGLRRHRHAQRPRSVFPQRPEE